jgi:AcrR family transcriptional regulator
MDRGRPALPKTTRTAKATAEPRRRRSTDELIGRIVQAAAAEFKKNGYAGATTASIAQAAEVTEAQLFRYFGSKAALFREAIFSPLDDQLVVFMDANLRADPVADVQGFRERADSYTVELQRLLSDNIESIKTILISQAYESKSSQGIGEIASLEQYLDRVGSNMASMLTGEPKVPPDLMARVSFGAVLGCIMFKHWLFPQGMASDAEIEKAIIDFVLEGIYANHSPPKRD